MRYSHIVETGLVAFIVCLCSPADAARPYVGTLLGNGTVTNRPVDINNNGQVAARLENPGGAGFEEALVLTGTDVKRLRVPSFGHNSAEGISDNGYVTGYLTNSDGDLRAYRWKDGTTEVLGTLGGRHSFGTAVNNHGQVIGYSSTNEGSAQAFLFDNGVMTNLGTLGGSSSSAADINSRGQIVGWATDALDARRAFVYQAGVMHDLGTLGGGFSLASAINEAGQIVGVSQTRDGVAHAFLWSAGVMVDLGTLGRRNSYAFDINDSGEIIGTVSGGGGPDSGFVFSAGVMAELEPLIAYASPTGIRTNFYPTAINNGGQMVGAVHLDDTGTFVYSLLLTPVPEPATWQMLLVGMVGVALSKTSRISRGGC